MVLLHTLDHLWREHLVTMEHLRSVIGLRGYGQRDPLNEYKAESFELFEAMLANLREQVTGTLMHFRVMDGSPPDELQPVELRRCRRTTAIPSPAMTSWPWPTPPFPPARGPPARTGAERRAPGAAGVRRPALSIRAIPPPRARFPQCDLPLRVGQEVQPCAKCHD